MTDMLEVLHGALCPSPVDNGRLFHYTTQAKLPEILECQVLLPHEASEGFPAVFLSQDEEWEIASFKGNYDWGVFFAKNPKAYVRDQYSRRVGGIARIEVNPKIPVVSIQQLKQANPNWAIGQSLWFNTLLRADVRKWRVSFKKIEAADWLAVETFDGESWQPVAHPNGQSTTQAH